MPFFKVNIKWQKEKYENVECDSDQHPEIFKALLFSLTGVAPERQTIMMPGGTLKDSWDKIKLKDGLTIMMMGSSEVIDDKSKVIEKPKFIEDMTEGQITQALKLPQGLKNLGNTCYMNATLQCLRSIPELFVAIKNTRTTLNQDVQRQLKFTQQIGQLFGNMDTAQYTITPHVVLKTLHELFPQFASTQELSPEQGGGAMLMQQDANECWTELMRCLQKTLNLSVDGAASQSPLPPSFGNSSTSWNFVDQFMTGRMAVKTINSEAESEIITSEEPFLQLSCFIDKDVKYLQTGIRNGLEGTLSKMSESLGRDAVFKRTSLMSRLPAYLSVQFVRFFYKEREKINAKVLKDVKFPMVLDMFEFCTEELQKRMSKMRENFKLMEDQRAETDRIIKNNNDAGLGGAETSSGRKQYHPYWFPDDVGSNSSGMYELRAVLTHQGRSSSSGHYVGWVRRPADNPAQDDVWLKYDDDYVTQVGPDDVLRLSGGGDWHCAYLLVYGPKPIEIIESATGSSNAAAASTTTVNSTDVNNGDIKNNSMDIGQ